MDPFPLFLDGKVMPLTVQDRMLKQKIFMIAKFFTYFKIISLYQNGTVSVLSYFWPPGFGDNLQKEENKIRDLVDFLKFEIRHVHVFVLAFKQTDNRMTYALRSMIGLLQKGRRALF